MKAVVSARHVESGFEIRDVAAPQPGPGQVRVAVRTIGVNFRDVHTAADTASGDGTIPGTDFAGVIDALGDGVSEFAVGERVFGAVMDGAYAQFVVTVPQMLFRLPVGVSFALGASLPVSGLTASFLVSQAGLSAGDVVVTWAAAGGLGCFLGGLWRANGIRSIGLTSSESKIEVAQLAGHQETINYRETDVVAEVQQRTENLGAHVVIDSVGGLRFAESFRMLRNCGTVILCGTSAGEPELSSLATELLASRRNLALREFYLVTHIFDQFNELPARVEQLLALLEDGSLQIPVTRHRFEEFAFAHDLLASGTTTGKMVLELDELV